MLFTWQWWVSQIFAALCLFCIVVSMQQKKRVTILTWNLIGTVFALTSVTFLWSFSAMILVGVATVRCITSLLFAIYLNTPKWVFYVTNCVLATAIIALNIVFWQGYLSILSMIVGIGFIISYMQTTPKNIRRTIVPIRIISTIYYFLLFAPVNAVIELTALASAIIGIIRFDTKKKLGHNTV
jgi:hypothetical protein